MPTRSYMFLLWTFSAIVETTIGGTWTDEGPVYSATIKAVPWNVKGNCCVQWTGVGGGVDKCLLQDDKIQSKDKRQSEKSRLSFVTTDKPEKVIAVCLHVDLCATLKKTCCA